MMKDYVPLAAALAAAYVGYKITVVMTLGRMPFLEMMPVRTPGFKGWLLGHLADMLNPTLEEHGDQYIHWFKRGGPSRVVYGRLLSSSRIFTINPTDLRHCLDDNVENYGKGRGYVVLQRLLGHGLVTMMDDAQHKVHRRELSPAFAPPVLKEIADEVFTLHARQMVTDLKAKAAECAAEGQDSTTQVVVQDALNNAVLNIMAQAAFKTTDKETTESVGKIFTICLDNLWSMGRLVPIIDAMMISKNNIILRARAKLSKVVRAILNRELSGEDETASSSSSERKYKVLIDYLIQSRQLSERGVTDHSITFMFAGFDTTSNALAWMLYYLASHPHVQERLYEELCQVMPLEGTACVDDLKGCTYLTNCCKETLRIMNPVQSIARCTKCDDVLPGTKTFIPAGTHVILPFHATHLNEELWGADAASFIPERWDDPSLRDAKAFIPFSYGRRNCIGKDFAMNEMKVLAAAIFRSFEGVWPHGVGRPPRVSTPVVKPKDPLRLHLRNRVE